MANRGGGGLKVVGVQVLHRYTMAEDPALAVAFANSLRSAAVAIITKSRTTSFTPYVSMSSLLGFLALV
jgi:hypothetical protein